MEGEKSMFTEKISVVVPVYNVEKYLEKCVESIKTQVYDNLEILLVDDGSTDSSGELCDKYAKDDSRIKVIHKENGGLSDARNAGIEAATGKYICFIDSDDYIEPEMMSVLYELAEKNNAEVACCGICDCYSDKRIPQSAVEEEFVCDGIEGLHRILEGKSIAGSICNKLILRDIIGDHRFLKGRIYEDAFFTPELMLSAKTVAATTKSLYNYWHRDGSITTKAFQKKNLDIIKAYEYTMDIVKERCPQLIPVAEFRVQWANFIVLDKLMETPDFRSSEYYKDVVTFLKRNWVKIIRSDYFTRNRRISAFALKMNVEFYKFLSIKSNKRVWGK